MKIRLLVDARQIGGVETHIMNLCEELRERNHDCSIIFVCDYPSNILYTLCKKKGIKYQACKSYRALFYLLFKEQPHLIHAHGYKANILARLFGILSRTPVVTTFHAGEKPQGRLILYNFLDRWTSVFSKNICVNKDIATDLPSKAEVIPNFVDLPKNSIRLRTDKPFQIYFIGRVSPEKGPLRFCQLAKQESSEFEWHMVGSGPLLDQCRNDNLKTIHFHGQVLDMMKIWPKVDLLCITSSYEGLPFVLLEAMSRGIPVVSFDVGAVKEVLANPEMIIECFNLPQMQERITAYFSKTLEQRQMMSNIARQRIEDNFSKKIVVSQIESFYKNCMRAHL